MNWKRFFAQVIVVLMCSVLGVNLGNGLLRLVNAKEKTSRKRAKAAAKPLARSLSASPATKPVSLTSRGTSCPNVKVQTFSLIAEDYSADEGLTAPRHGGVDNASIDMVISGLPDNTYVPLTLTFNLSTSQNTTTIHNTDDVLLSDSIAESEVDIYLAGVGTNFLIQGYTQISQDSSISQAGNPLPSGMLQYTVMVSNGTNNITAIIQASAVSSIDAATASTVIALDFLGASFSTDSSQAINTPPPKSFLLSPAVLNQCPDNCGKLTQDIEDLVAELQGRYNDLLEDEYNLYCNNYFIPLTINGDYIGSYFGHLIQFTQKQTSLINLSNQAGALGCIVPQDAVEWAYIPEPTQPTNPPCN